MILYQEYCQGISYTNSNKICTVFFNRNASNISLVNIFLRADKKKYFILHCINTYLDFLFVGAFQVILHLTKTRTMKLPGGTREWDRSSLGANSPSYREKLRDSHTHVSVLKYNQ